MRRVPPAMLGVGLVVIIAGCAVLIGHITDYLSHPLAISSTSGLTVFTDADGGLVSYDYFQPGFGANLITAGGALMFASLFLLAILWRKRPKSS